MTDQALASPPSGAAPPMQRLADSLRRLVPPPAAEELALPPMPRPSPAVAAALARSADAARRAARVHRPRSFIRTIIESFASACAFIPYALIALALRFVMARVFFLDGQLKVDGPRVPVNFQDFDFSLVLPMRVKSETFATFVDFYSALPVPPVLAAYIVSYAEFILPVMLVLGLGTRFAALAFLVLAGMQLYVQPAELWTTYVYWGAILLVLLARGAGAISADHVIRYVTRR